MTKLCQVIFCGRMFFFAFVFFPPGGARAEEPRPEASALVRNLYLEILEREPDEDGLAHYVSSIAGGNHDEAWVRSALENSDERKGLLRAKRNRFRFRLVAPLALLACVFFFYLGMSGKLDSRSACAAYGRRAFFMALAILFVLIAATRANRLSGPLDEPMAWRQCDTAFFADEFYHNGIDFTKPSVCWLADHKTLVLEFPLPEAIMALGYHAFGNHYWVSRVITLIFFFGSAVYLFLAASLFMSLPTAMTGALVYAILPLSLFYSRALHIDFHTVFLAHGMLYHLAAPRSKWTMLHFFTGVLFGILGFLIKAPYVFYLFPMALILIAYQKDWKRLVWTIGAGGLTAAVFLLWRWYAVHINAAAPDWDFMPGYYKFVDRGYWYYGPWSLRSDPGAWKLIQQRLQYDVATTTGLLLLLPGAGLALAWALRLKKTGLLLLAWTAAVFGYLIIFFNISLIHDYYQIPFLAPAALLAALTITTLATFPTPGRIKSPRAWRIMTMTLALVALAVLVRGSLRYANKNYYKLDHKHIQAGLIIQRETPEDDLLIAVMQGSDHSDPRFLYRARRLGWALNIRYLGREVVAEMAKRGARQLAVLVQDERPEALFPDLQFRRFKLEEEPWQLALADLAEWTEDAGTGQEK